MSPMNRKIRQVILSVTICFGLLASWSAIGAACIVSDPYNHTTDIPITGTYTTATGAADPSVTVDKQISMLSVFGNWRLSLNKLGMMLIVR